MARINGYAITGNELQAMVNERILGAKGAIPATTRCLSNAEVYNGAHVYLGSAPNSIFLPVHDLGGGQYGASPNWLANFSNINPVQATGTIVFEMNQENNPYLNCDLFGQVNGSPLRLDPGSSLDGMFFGGPQYSPNMAGSVKIGNQITIQANFGRADQESPGNWGWNGNGFGILEIYKNSVLISTQSTAYRTAIFSPNLTSLSNSLIIEAGVNYYIKAYSYIDNRFRGDVNYSTSFCDVCNNETGTVSVVGNATTFCASTSFTSSSFATLPVNTYRLAIGGNALNITTNGTTTAVMYGGGCTACIGNGATWSYVYQNCLGCTTRNIYQDTNTCSATYGQYKINFDGTATTTAPANTGACDTAQNWVSNNTVLCIDCTTVTVYKNTNSCSSNYNFYRYTNPTTSATITQESDPSGSACSTGANWVFKYYNCSSCNTRSVERDENPCSSTYLGYTVNHGVNVGTTAPTNTGECSACCGQSTTQVWTATGVVRCLDCVSQLQQKQTNICATAYDTLRWVNGGSNCNTTADWTIAFSSYSCLGCAKYYNEIDLNACSSTYGQVRRSSVLIDAVTTYCGACCGQSATPDWTILFGSYGCVGCDKYYLEVDLNSCSPSYQGTRVSDAIAEQSSSYCCYYTNCKSYQMMDYGWVNYIDCMGYDHYEYLNPWDTFCAQQLSGGMAYQTGDCDGYVAPN